MAPQNLTFPKFSSASERRTDRITGRFRSFFKMKHAGMISAKSPFNRGVTFDTTPRPKAP